MLAYTMEIEHGFCKVRIARHGPNQAEVEHFLSWLEEEHMIIVWDHDPQFREIDGVDAATRRRIVEYLTALGRTFQRVRDEV